LGTTVARPVAAASIKAKQAQRAVIRGGGLRATVLGSAGRGALCVLRRSSWCGTGQVPAPRGRERLEEGAAGQCRAIASASPVRGSQLARSAPNTHNRGILWLVTSSAASREIGPPPELPTRPKRRDGSSSGRGDALRRERAAMPGLAQQAPLLCALPLRAQGQAVRLQLHPGRPPPPQARPPAGRMPRSPGHERPATPAAGGDGRGPGRRPHLPLRRGGLLGRGGSGQPRGEPGPAPAARGPAPGAAAPRASRARARIPACQPPASPPQVRCFLGDDEQRWFMWYTGRRAEGHQLDALTPSSGKIGGRGCWGAGACWGVLGVVG
jgi:hypothetical protein